MVYTKDYIYSISNNLNTLSIIFNYKTSVIGGPYLHISLNQSIYIALNYENKTSYVKNHNYDAKLLDYFS